MWACALTCPLIRGNRCLDERYVVKNLVARSCLFQDQFDYRRDLDQVFGREWRDVRQSTARCNVRSGLYLRSSPISTKTPRPTFVEFHALASIPESSSFARGEKRSRCAVSAGPRAAKARRFSLPGSQLRIIRTNIHPARRRGHGAIEGGIPERRPGVAGAHGGRWAATPVPAKALPRCKQIAA